MTRGGGNLVQFYFAAGPRARASKLQSTGHVGHSAYFCKQSLPGTQSCSFPYILSVAAFVTWEQGRTAVAEPIQPSKPKMVTAWPFREFHDPDLKYEVEKR